MITHQRICDISGRDNIQRDDEEVDLQFFENALRQMASLRERAKSMPDEERREFAAKMMLSLLENLDIDNENEDQ